VITTVVNFLSAKIVLVVVTVVVVAAAVPTLIIAIHGNTITITAGPVASSSRNHDEDERTRVIHDVHNAADTVIVKLNGEEASCATQIDQLAAKSKLSATATAAALKKGKDDFHKSVAPFINELKADEDEIDHLTVVTIQVEQTFLVRINQVEVIGLGDHDSVGVLITVCQTIIVQVTQVIVVVVQGGSDEVDDDIRTAA